MTTSESSSKAAKGHTGSSISVPTTNQSKLIVVFAVFTIVASIALTLALAFHYPTASDTTSVLGVVAPIFTAVIGVIVGGGAGLATGSAGKKAVQDDLDDSTAKVQTARSELEVLDSAVTKVFGTIKQSLTSRQGSLKLYATLAPDGEPVADLEELDTITSSIAHLKGTLE